MSVAEMTEKEVNEFKMPEIQQGAPIRWFRYGTARDTSILGFVQKVKARSVTVWTTEGLRYNNVRHISDPKLRLNREQREDGAWDFTDGYMTTEEVNRLLKLVKKLEPSRVAAFEQTIEEQGKLIQTLQAEIEGIKKSLKS